MNRATRIRWGLRGTGALFVLSLVALASFALLLSLAHAAPGAHGPGGEHLDAPGATVAASGLARLPDGSVNVPKLAQRRMDIRTVLGPVVAASASFELPGRITMDPNAGGRVQAAYGGRIEPGSNGLPLAGQTVRRGQVLAYVRHHAEPFALAQQQAQRTELRTLKTLAEQRVKRLETLEGTVPRKDIEAARAEAAGLTERERSIGASIGAREALIAPVAGVISRADVVTGQMVEARDVLFEVIDPSRLLVEATTPDATLAGRIAGASLQGVVGAQLKLVGAARSLRDGVLPLTFSLRNEKPGAAMSLAVGQPVTLIVMSNERSEGIVLPAQAVVRNAANESVVWIKSGAERFIAQPVQVRALDAQTVLVIKGLAPDNRVVVQGAPLIAQIR
ncbi:MAG: HlyD family efflux transporter periplasmic adaptor subunit [Betaproteobacteria bacterium]|nr:MAG: HlyD family efflux transporter periplasmic adaptor subunit [Betaproteobacteria bacterium]